MRRPKKHIWWIDNERQWSEVVKLLQEIDYAQRKGYQDELEAATDTLKRMPNFPYPFEQGDTFIVQMRPRLVTGASNSILHYQRPRGRQRRTNGAVYA